MPEQKKKTIQKDLQIEQQNQETFHANNYEEFDDWKRLEKWRPGRRNFP